MSIDADLWKGASGDTLGERAHLDPALSGCMEGLETRSGRAEGQCRACGLRDALGDLSCVVAGGGTLLV